MEENTGEPLFAWHELKAEIRRGDYEIPVEPSELNERERQLVQVGAAAMQNLLPTAPEFQIHHDSSSCSGVIYGYVRDLEDNDSQHLELECQDCGDKWSTSII